MKVLSINGATTLNLVGSRFEQNSTTKTITITGGSSALNDITDVVIVSSPVAGDSLVYDGSGWVQAQTPVSQLLVTSNSSSAYRFTGAGFPSTSGDNPDLHLKKVKLITLLTTLVVHTHSEYNQQPVQVVQRIILVLPIIMLLLVQ